MPHPELTSNPENNELYDNSLNKELIDTSLGVLKWYISSPKNKESRLTPWQFLSLWETKNQNYLKYLYKVETWWTPESIRNKAVSAWLAKSKEWIQITNAKAIPYGETHRFSAWDEIFVRIPKLKEESNRDNPDYFDNTKIVETDKQYESKWIILKRDVWMTFYVMNINDIKYITNKKGKRASRNATINHLREKLWALPEFSYLKRDEYKPKADDVTQTFNIRPDFAEYLHKNPNTYYIPIPMDSTKRKIQDNEFKEYAKNWVDDLCKKDEPYWKYWKWLDKTKLARFFTAIAKVETGKTNKEIWTDEYHRRETGKHNCFSFWPHHILMEWPWKTAYNKFKNEWYFSTEWQTYHPKNSTMRCMWFIVEKMKDLWNKEEDIQKNIEDMLSFFNKTTVTWNDFRNFARMYNGKHYAKNNYHNKFAQAWNLLW